MSKWCNLIFVFVLGFFIASCTVHNRIGNTQIPRDSFVYMQQDMQYVVCDLVNFECKQEEDKYFASGVLIKKSKKKDKSYILTASHFCDGIQPNVQYMVLSADRKIVAYTLEGDEHTATIIAQDTVHDLCLLEIEYVKNKTSNVAQAEPEPGDRIYNAAAPTGVWAPNMVLLFEGFFSGNKGINMMTTIPAAPGSSGSPIFNRHGEVIGIIHSVNRFFDNVSLAARLKDIRKFLDKHLNDV